MPATRGAFVQAVQAALQPHADAGRAEAMAAYMRGHFVFLGIPAPARRAAVAALLKEAPPPGELLPRSQALWALPAREYQYVAVDLLLRHHRALAAGDVDALLQLACARAWWDSVDGLAGVVGRVLRRARRETPAVQQCMDQALVHEVLWVRRIAMLHQLGWRGETDRQRLFSFALQLAGEEDFFIRKAIGWALRDYARHDPAAVRGFLQQHGAQLSPLSVREASRHLG